MTEDFQSNLKRIRGLILDMDGVLWRDSTPIGDLSKIFQRITSRGLRVLMLTNNAGRSIQDYVEKLAGFGVVVEPWQVVSSATATANYLQNRFPDGGEIFVIGEQSLIELFEAQGFRQGTRNPQAVVAALDRGINYEKLKEATLLLRRGIPFIGTNPDRSYPIPEGEAPGAGAILAALEAASGVEPTIIGKPKKQIFSLALERLGTLPDETLVVGDRLETDILGAQTVGCISALVLSGVSTVQEVVKWEPPPDFVVGNLSELLDLFT